ncbi:hypothetical protein ACFH04_07515 [Streptomyces noboritoensis]|uniref:J domain-containing protein n=1 Tax=Streptomyces noboritoensis TaxID=67337 RepID=A0ABV6TCR9_9ACTN
MARAERSVPGMQPRVQRLVCGWCEMQWNRPRRRGPAPRWCSDACKQAAWRSRVGPEELSVRRRRAETERAKALQLTWYRAVFRSISPLHPLPTATAQSLLVELAGHAPDSTAGAKLLYRKAATRWHPDLTHGDEEVFKLLEHVYQTVQLPAPPTRRPC